MYSHFIFYLDYVNVNGFFKRNINLHKSSILRALKMTREERKFGLNFIECQTFC